MRFDDGGPRPPAAGEVRHASVPHAMTEEEGRRAGEAALAAMAGEAAPAAFAMEVANESWDEPRAATLDRPAPIPGDAVPSAPGTVTALAVVNGVPVLAAMDVRDGEDVRLEIAGGMPMAVVDFAHVAKIRTIVHGPSDSVEIELANEICSAAYGEPVPGPDSAQQQQPEEESEGDRMMAFFSGKTSW